MIKIKKVPFLLCIFLMIGLSCQAQDPRPFRFGLKASPTIGWIDPDTKGINADGATMGFTYGLIADFTLGNSFNYALNTGVEIATFGGKLSYADLVTPVDTQFSARNNAELSYRYVNIPLAIKMKTNEIGYNTYFAKFGVTTGLRVRARQNNSYTLPTGTFEDENVDVLADIAPIRMGILIGAGVEYNFHGKTALMAGINFSNGFTNLFERDKKYYELDSNGDVAIINGEPLQTLKQKGIANYLSIDLGLLF